MNPTAKYLNNNFQTTTMWIDPVILKIGFLEIRYYGIVYVIGFLLAYYLLARNSKKIGIDMKQVDDYVVYLMLGVIIGARIFHFIFSDPLIFFRDPLELFKVWHGGMSFFGGLFGAIIATHMFCRKFKARCLRIADIVVLPASFGLAIGRIANFINNELYGTITDVSWCINFPNIAGCRHPYQLYASFSHFVMLGILIYLYKKKLRKGTIFFSFILIYGIFRLITDFFREDPRFLALTVWQYLSVVLVSVSIYYLRKSKKS